MKASDMLEQSHLLVFQTLEDLPETAWDIPGVSGDWSVKDIIAHLASYEQVLIDALNTFSGAKPTASLQAFINDPTSFDTAQVEARKYHTAQQVEDEYQELQIQSSSLLAGIPSEISQQPGTIPWSGTGQSLADFIQTLYEHTRKHCAQITDFRHRKGVAEPLAES
jgi:uncharacterized damage-inducible protein DinB